MPNSRLIIGTMSWGKWGKQLSLKEQSGLIEFCVEQGYCSFDGADIYGDYSTEHTFGEALSQSGVGRSEIEIISKCGIQLVGGSRHNKIKHYNYSTDYIVQSAEQSLRDLQTDYLDVYLVHRPSPLMDPDVIAEAVTQLKQNGKIKRFGVSNFTPAQVELISSRIEVEVNQIEFSITAVDAIYDGSLDQMLQRSIEPMVYSPLGTIFKNDNPSNTRIRNELLVLKEKYGVSESAIVLAWILRHPAKCRPIIGTTQKTRIAKASHAVDLNLELEDWFSLLEASRGLEVP